MLPSAITGLMRDTVTVKVLVGEDAYGAKQYADPVQVRARVTHKRSMVATATGNEFVVTTMVYMDDITGFVEDSQVTLPDGASHNVDHFTRPAWPDGSHHLEVML
jgi:hypothetical protein